MKISLKLMTRIALVAALYAVLTLILAPISYGQFQIRVSETLTILPYYLGGWSAVGLWIGCMIANYGSPFGLIDIIFGSLFTLIAALLTARSKNKYTAGIYPVVINAFGIGFILYYAGGLEFWLNVIYVGIGQMFAVYVIGIPIMTILNKKINFKNLL